VADFRPESPADFAEMRRPGSFGALQAMLARLATIPDAVIASAADANGAGDRHADRHAELAGHAGIRFQRLRPPEGLDFNDVLRQRRGI